MQSIYRVISLSALFLVVKLSLLAQCTNPISSFPYNEDFETSNGVWSTGGTHSDWVWGSPHKNTISSAGSGLKCWIVGDSINNNNNTLAGHTAGSPFYAFGERSYVKSPCFNFTNLQHPFISMQIFWESEKKYDGTNLQYSLDGGVTWSVLGSSTDPVDCLDSNWYNTASVKYLDSLISPVKTGWCGNIQTTHGNCQGGGGSGGWVTAKHCMSSLAGQPSVIFRFAFGAGTSCNDFDGFAFDNITIEEAPANTADFNYQCVNSRTVSFSGLVTKCPTVFGWNFGDPNSGANNISHTQNATHTFSGPGVYNVTFIDSGPCNAAATITKSITILAANPTVTNPGCSVSTGSAIANPSGGNGPYTYLWSTTPAQTTDTATNLAAGTYTVTVNATNACAVTATATIANVTGISASVTAITPAICGSSIGTATVTATGGTLPYTYTWSTIPAQTTQTAINLAPGNYTVTVKDGNNCTTTATATIVNGGGITATISAHTNATCGEFNGNATVSVSGGAAPYTYTWSTTPTQTTPTAINLTGGSYTVTVKDGNNCTAVATIAITQSTGITATIALTTPTTCNQSLGAASVAVQGGTTPYTYVWGTFPVQTRDTAIGLAAGTYTVTVNDGNNCTATTTATITQPGGVSATITATTNVTCNGLSNGTATVTASGGTGPYTYAWGVLPAQNTATATGLAAGTYSVTVKDQTNCTYQVSTILTEPLVLKDTISSKTNVLCNGLATGSATVLVSGGTVPYTYSWNTSPIQTTATATNLLAGNYTVSIKDSNNCSASINVTIAQPIALQLNINKDDARCGVANGSAWAVISGGVSPYTILWNTVPTQNTDTIINLSGGNYSVSISDANGCTTTANTTIVEPTAVSASITSSANVTCNGLTNGNATVTAIGGSGQYTYTWSTTPTQTNATATNLGAGSYTVTVKDSNNCTATATITITQPNPLKDTVTTYNNVTCNGFNDASATAIAVGGTLPYTFTWNTSPVQTGATATNLGAGLFTVTVKDSNNCTATYSLTITQPNAISLTASGSNATCGNANGKVWANVSGGTNPYTYLWNTTPTQNTDTANNLSGGTYSIVISDDNGCTSTATDSIQQLPGIIANVITTSNASCFGSNNGSAYIRVGASNGTLSYQWNTSPVQTSDTATKLTAGIYSVTLTDSLACKLILNDTITSPAKLSFTAMANNITCNGLGNGMIKLSPDSFQYSLNGASFSNYTIYNNLTAGIYTLVAKDTLGCKDTLTNGVTITEPAKIVLTITPDSSLIIKGSQVNLTTAVTGGIKQYQYTWTPDSTLSCATCANPNALPMDTTIYKVLVTDSNGCVDSAFAKVYVEAQLLISFPSAFTPNGDGHNDLFKAITNGAAVDTFSVKIFDRWGLNVFETTKIADGWDGKYKGKEAPTETYVWVAEYRATGTTKTVYLKGAFTLLR